MTVRWLAITAAALLAAGTTPGEPALKSDKERLSYALGMDLGRKLRAMSLDVEPAMVGRGLEDALSGGRTLLTQEDVRAALAAMQSDLKGRQAAHLSARAGEAFLAENGTRPGVVTTPSGLQYKVLQQGTGRRPTETDAVECHYRGTLVDGTEFDSSYSRGRPAVLKVKEDVIPGWTEALKLMPVGSRWQLVVPPRLAYGERGSGRIGPNATLIFEIELLGIL